MHFLFGGQDEICHCSGIFFPWLRKYLFLYFVGRVLLLSRDSSCWRLDTHEVINSATLLLLSHKQEESSLVLLLPLDKGTKTVTLDSGKELSVYTYPDVWLTENKCISNKNETLHSWVLMHIRACFPTCSYSVCDVTNKRKEAQGETVRIHVRIHSAFPQKQWKWSSCTFLPSCYIAVFGSLPALTRLTTFAVSLLPWQPFFGGSTSINQISGKIKCGEEVLATLTGHWVTFDNRSCWQGSGEEWQLLAGSPCWNGRWKGPVQLVLASPRACGGAEPGPHLSRCLWRSFTLQ